MVFCVMRNAFYSARAFIRRARPFLSRKSRKHVVFAERKTKLSEPLMPNAQARRGTRSAHGFMAMMVFIAATAGVIASTGEAEGQDRSPRLWSDSTGNFSVKAMLIRKTEDVVTLLTSDGREVTVPLSRLSDRDRRYLRGAEAGPAKKAPPTATGKAITQLLAAPPLPAGEVELIDLPDLLQVPVFIDQRELEQSGLAVDTPLDLKNGHESLQEQLDDSLESIDLAWCTTQTVLVITTKRGIYDFATAKFYRIPTPRGAFNGRGGGAAMFDSSSVIRKVEQVAPDSWEVMGGAGTISPLVIPVYIVRQTPPVHRQLTKEITCQPIPRRYGHPFDLQSVTVVAKNHTLEDVITSIATQLGVVVEFSRSVADIGIDPSGSRLDLDFKNVSGKDALDLVLSQ